MLSAIGVIPGAECRIPGWETGMGGGIVTLPPYKHSFSSSWWYIHVWLFGFQE